MFTNGFRFRVGRSLVLGLIWTSAALGDCPLFAAAVHYGAGSRTGCVAAASSIKGIHGGQAGSWSMRARNA